MWGREEGEEPRGERKGNRGSLGRKIRRDVDIGEGERWRKGESRWANDRREKRGRGETKGVDEGEGR